MEADSLLFSYLCRMEVKEVKVTGWEIALDAARMTARKDPLNKEPSEGWKCRMLLAEHSPIRMVQYSWVWNDIPMWVTVHFVRHHIGCEKFVATQRTDRTGSDIPRGEHKQGELNSMMFVCNAQELMNISKERLCAMASKETRDAWKAALDAISEKDNVVTRFCVKKCVYRGFCPEPQGCGYDKTEKFKEERKNYEENKKTLSLQR